MKDRKLTQLILLLNKDECEEFALFVRSPFFNKQELLITLWDCFLDFYSDPGNGEFTEEVVWNKVFPDEPFNKSKLAQYLTKLGKLIELFIQMQGALESNFALDDLAAKFFYNKKSSYFFEKNHKDFQKKFKKHNPKIPEDYLAFYHMEVNNHNHHVAVTSNPSLEPLYQNLNLALDQFIIIEKLRLGTLQYINNMGKSGPADTAFTDQVYEYAKKVIDEVCPLAQLWIHAYSLISNIQSEPVYHELKRFWLMNQQEFDSSTNMKMVTVLEVSMRQVFQNRRMQFMEELFSIYLMQVQQKWLIREGVVHYRTLNNIVFVSLYLKKTDWAKAFIEDHIQYMVPETRKAVYEYNLARVEFAEKTFSASLVRLSQMDLFDTQMALGSKRIQLKAYYELNENDLMDSGINALRVYLHRVKGVNESFKNLHHLFTNVLNRLFKIKVGDKNREALQKVKEEVDENRFIPEYDWIVEKIQELE
jgi:tetratricopeptide (TPR) repeat protein